MQEEVRTYNEHQVLITTDWTKRKVTITGEDHKRYATLYRPLAVSQWSIIFVCKLGPGRRPKEVKLTLTKISDDIQHLIDRAGQFVAGSDLPSVLDFTQFNELTASQEALVKSLATEFKKKVKRPKLGT